MSSCSSFSFSIIAIQEIGNKESLDLIINELNNPTIPSIKNLSNSSQGKWKYTISDAVDQIVQVNQVRISFLSFSTRFYLKRDVNTSGFCMMNQMVLN